MIPPAPSPPSASTPTSRAPTRPTSTSTTCSPPPPAQLAVTANHVTGGNGTALLLSDLGDTPLSALNGLSLNETWAKHVEDYAVRTQQAGLDLAATQVVTESLQSQRAAVSGVSIDEEAINLIAFQRAYQGSARFLNVVDELMQTLLTLVA